jgi:hypothetical protein
VQTSVHSSATAGHDATATRTGDVYVTGKEEQVSKGSSLDEDSNCTCTVPCTGTIGFDADTVAKVSTEVSADVRPTDDWRDTVELKERSNNEHRENEKATADLDERPSVVPSDEHPSHRAPNGEPLSRSALVVALAQNFGRRAFLGSRQAFKPTSFHCVRPPQVHIHTYLTRVSTYFQCSDEALLIGLVYVDRIMKARSEVVFNGLSMHRLIVTSMMLAAKFHDDRFFSNSHYAKVGGISLKELCNLEGQFLHLIDWRLNVTTEEFEKYMDNMHSIVREMKSKMPAQIVAKTQVVSTPEVAS